MIFWQILVAVVFSKTDVDSAFDRQYIIEEPTRNGKFSRYEFRAGLPDFS
jgi:hypothetical protein